MCKTSRSTTKRCNTQEKLINKWQQRNTLKDSLTGVPSFLSLVWIHVAVRRGHHIHFTGSRPRLLHEMKISVTFQKQMLVLYAQCLLWGNTSPSSISVEQTRHKKHNLTRNVRPGRGCKVSQTMTSFKGDTDTNTTSQSSNCDVKRTQNRGVYG